MIKKCPVCGEEFEVIQKTQKYCSKECRTKAYYLRNRERKLAYSKQYYKQIKENFKQPKKVKSKKTDYPCYSYHETRVAKIPTKMCLDCPTERCRFDHD